MGGEKEIVVVPAFGQGRLLPCMELCKLIAARNFKTTLVIFSNLSSSVTSSFLSHPLIHVLQVPSPPPGNDSDFHRQNARSQNQMLLCLETHFADSSSRPLCAIVDVLIIMGWTSDTFKKFQIPTIGFFTSGACSAAMEHAAWKARPTDLRPGETLSLPGLPQEMALTNSDFKRRSPGGPHKGGRNGGPQPSDPSFTGKRRKMGPPPLPGGLPPWVDDVEDSVGLMINTCDDIEKPYIEYLAGQMGRPVWSVGPLMPEKYWESSGKLLSDRDIRTNKKSNVTEDEVIQWLDSKPCASVLYVSFGSELGPTMEEYPSLAEALEQSEHPFLWVIQPGAGKSGPPSGPGGSSSGGYFPEGLSERVGKRGMIIQGWAPQLLILSHPLTGGFLSQCGWNSTVEAIGRGVPFMAWPIRGDQYYNAKLVVSHLRIGCQVSDDMSQTMQKEEIVEGIERLMDDVEVKKQAAELKCKFENGFPKTSIAALDHFRDFINKKAD